MLSPAARALTGAGAALLGASWRRHGELPAAGALGPGVLPLGALATAPQQRQATRDAFGTGIAPVGMVSHGSHAISGGAVSSRASRDAHPDIVPSAGKLARFQQVFAELSHGRGWLPVASSAELMQAMGLRLAPHEVRALAAQEAAAFSDSNPDRLPYEVALRMYQKALLGGVAQSAIDAAVTRLVQDAIGDDVAEEVLPVSRKGARARSGITPRPVGSTPRSPVLTQRTSPRRQGAAGGLAARYAPSPRLQQLQQPVLAAANSPPAVARAAAAVLGTPVASASQQLESASTSCGRQAGASQAGLACSSAAWSPGRKAGFVKGLVALDRAGAAPAAARRREWAASAA